jgi:hypothetical protein
MLRAAPIGALWQPFLYLTLLGVVVVAFATLRFRSFLVPAGGRTRRIRRPRRQRAGAVQAQPAVPGRRPGDWWP